MRELLLLCLVIGLPEVVPLIVPDVECNIYVVSPHDRGAGTLRQAFAEAGSCDGYANIHVAVPTVTIAQSLPELSNPYGVRILGQIPDASLIATRAMTLVHIRAPAVVIQGMTLKGNGGTGIQARSHSVDITDSHIQGFAQGLVLSQRHGFTEVRDSSIDNAQVGVLMLGDHSRLSLQHVRISGAGDTAIMIPGRGDNRVGLHTVSMDSNRVDLRANQADIYVANSRFNFTQDTNIAMHSGQLAVHASTLATAGLTSVQVDGPVGIALNEVTLNSRGVGLQAPEARTLRVQASRFPDSTTPWVVGGTTQVVNDGADGMRMHTGAGVAG